MLKRYPLHWYITFPPLTNIGSKKLAANIKHANFRRGVSEIWTALYIPWRTFFDLLRKFGGEFSFLICEDLFLFGDRSQCEAIAAPKFRFPSKKSALAMCLPDIHGLRRLGTTPPAPVCNAFRCYKLLNTRHLNETFKKTKQVLMWVQAPLSKTLVARLTTYNCALTKTDTKYTHLVITTYADWKLNFESCKTSQCLKMAWTINSNYSIILAALRSITRLKRL